MAKIEDYKLQMYVDGELDSSELSVVENYIASNKEAKLLVENYKKINHLISSTYNKIKSEDMPKKTLDLLVEKDKNFINQILNFKIRLVPALATLSIATIITLTSFNIVFKINSESNPAMLLSDNNKNMVLKQLEDILQTSEDELSGIVSLSDKNIEYEIIKTYVNANNSDCKDLKFRDFKIKKVTINEATFCKNKDNNWKVIKIEFVKGIQKDT